MRIDDLHVEELLELDPDGGVVRFAGQRALVLDAVAMGVLRQYLVENFGPAAARAVLTQFGFAQGWRMAEALRDGVAWASDDDWRRAGPHIVALAGMFRCQAGLDDPRSPEGATLLASYEAEQHLLHLGRADSPVCWTICGLMSGYLSRTSGEEIFVFEDRCLATGADACHILGRTREAWGSERAAELSYYDAGHLQDCLDVSLERVTRTLVAVEATLAAHRRKLVLVEPEFAEPDSIVARSPQMKRTLDLARRVAKVDASVLVTGESGVGKERIARLLHDTSPRAAGPFVAINCGAITETLLESELFGHRRGAFTGATADRPGLFEAASRGTLLLDEIGEVSPGMQVKLLRVLQEHEVRRVGDNQARNVDVRIIASTNRSLSECVAEGTFREDLYYRLRVVELHVPPLRERRDDILPLARVLLASAANRMGRSVSGLTPDVADQLLRHPWPGNVRELENAMERAVALAEGGRIEVEDLPPELRPRVAAPVLDADAVQPLREIERDYILAVLKLNGGNQTVTARQLGIGTATLFRRLKRYGLTRKPRSS